MILNHIDVAATHAHLDGNAILIITGACVLRFIIALLYIFSPGSTAQTVNWKLEVVSTGLAFIIYFLLIMIGDFPITNGWAFVIGFAPRTVLPLLTSLKPGSKISDMLQAPEKATTPETKDTAPPTNDSGTGSEHP